MVKFAVVGHDTGFAISYALAADHPDRVDRRQTHATQRSRFRVKAEALARRPRLVPTLVPRRLSLARSRTPKCRKPPSEAGFGIVGAARFELGPFGPQPSRNRCRSVRERPDRPMRPGSWRIWTHKTQQSVPKGYHERSQVRGGAPTRRSRRRTDSRARRVPVPPGEDWAAIYLEGPTSRGELSYGALRSMPARENLIDSDLNNHHRDTLQTDPQPSGERQHRVASGPLATERGRECGSRAQRESQGHDRLRDRGPPAASRQGHRRADGRRPAPDAELSRTCRTTRRGGRALARSWRQPAGQPHLASTRSGCAPRQSPHLRVRHHLHQTVDDLDG